MKYDELNNFILNYIRYNKTKSAIMLTGAWGTGKSYYIENTLKDFLDDNKKGYVVVSLYGITNLEDLSKAIYFESKLSKLKSKSFKTKLSQLISKFFKTKSNNSLYKKEIINSGIVVGKTIIKGIANRYIIDLSVSNNDFKKIYESINLTNKIIILEDIERTGIDIIELLGFVNSLTDRDDVKVLLVANEDEILTDIGNDNSENDDVSSLNEKNNTAKVYMYQKIKEKTISDTISFEPDWLDCIKSILSQFNEEFLDKYKTEDFCDVVKELFTKNDNGKFSESELDLITSELDKYHINSQKTHINFRTFIFATQKFVDLMKLTNLKKYDEHSEFIDYIYYSIIKFSNHYKQNKKVEWSGNDNYSFDLGTSDYPLYRFCFDYIVSQKTDDFNLNKCYNDYLELCNHKKNIEIFQNYSILTEQEVTDNIRDLEEKINKNEIALSVYGKILFYLVVLEKNIDYNITSIVDSMKKNVIGHVNELGDAAEFSYASVIDDFDIKNSYIEKSNQLKIEARKTDSISIEISYKPENVENECKKISKLYSGIFLDVPFLSKIDVNKYSNLFISCSSQQMQMIRQLFRNIYSGEYINNQNEISAIKKLIECLNKLDKTKCDRIQILNINWFLKDLEKYCEDSKKLK